MCQDAQCRTFYLKVLQQALALVAQWAGHHPTNGKVASSIPGQGTCLGCGPGPWLGGMQEATDRCFSLSLPPSPLSKIK